MEIELIRALIFSYFTVVRRTIQDAVPKAIMHFLVNHVKANLHERLLQLLFRDDQAAVLLQEDPGVAAERTRCRSRLQVFDKASAILAEMSESLPLVL